MLDWLDLIPNLGVPGVPGVPARFSAGLRGTPANVAGVPGVPEHQRGTPGTPAGTPAAIHKTLKNIEEHPEHPEHRKNDGLALYSGWVRQLARLDTSRAPAGIAPSLWPMILADALWIARVHGEAAAAFGWSASDLFGIGREPGNGGLADRLEGARWLAFTAGVAHWRGDDGEGWLWRRTLTAKPVLWDA